MFAKVRGHCTNDICESSPGQIIALCLTFYDVEPKCRKINKYNYTTNEIT